jgi:hypothetical protein
VACFGLYQFGKSSVDRAARHLLFRAQGFPSRKTELAFVATVMQPGNSNPVALAEAFDTWTYTHNAACNFVPRDKGQLGYRAQQIPFAVCQMIVRMTYPASFDLDQDFTRFYFGVGHILDLEWDAKLV